MSFRAGHPPVLPERAKPNGHARWCTCESCMEPVMDHMNGEAPKHGPPVPKTRAEFTAALDRAYNAGVERGREVA